MPPSPFLVLPLLPVLVQVLGFADVRLVPNAGVGGTEEERHLHQARGDIQQT